MEKKVKSCEPGQHNFVWDEEQNRTRIDGGRYHKCTICGDLAFSKNAHESSRQKIARIEEGRRKFLEEQLRKIK